MAGRAAAKKEGWARAVVDVPVGAEDDELRTGPGPLVVRSEGEGRGGQHAPGAGLRVVGGAVGSGHGLETVAPSAPHEHLAPGPGGHVVGASLDRGLREERPPAFDRVVGRAVAEALPDRADLERRVSTPDEEL